MNLLPEFKKYLFSQSKPSSKVTAKNYISDVSRFVKWFEVKFRSFSPELVTPEIIGEFKQSGSLAISSKERNLSSLRKFFNFLVLEGVISESPFKQSNNQTMEQSDPYKLKAFKDYLYVYNASKLTIKNYLMDLKSFFRWLEEVTNSKSAWDMKEKDVLGKVDSVLLEEYKRRLLASLPASPSLGGESWRSGPYAPRTINRKLSSLRKYLKWATDEGLIPSGHFGRESHLLGAARLSISQNLSLGRSLSQIRQLSSNQNKNEFGSSLSSPKSEFPSSAYSKFPPFRLVQKISRTIVFIPEFILVNPLASLTRSAEHLIWKLSGRPVFKKSIVNRKLKIVNLPKESFAPFAISTTHLPFHKKLLFHIVHTRPQWYKKYHSYSFSHYLHLAILVVVMSAVGFGIYQNINPKPSSGVLGFANPQIPPRILSFQGRLTDSSDNPIASSTNLRFALYDSPTGTGSALLWQEVDTVSPDSEGIFSLLLGNRTTMSQSLFAERAGLWLGVTVGQTAELTPRQRLATVAYAENADNLQGLPPITQSGVGQTNVILALDSSGNLTIGGTATPTFQATGGKFTVSGNVLALTTTAGSKSDVQIIPASQGLIDLQRPIRNTSNNNNIATALGAVEFDDLVAILATSSGQSAFTVNQNGAGPILSASSSGTAKFTLSNAGAGTFADDLAINGGDITSSQTTFNLLNSTVTTLNIGGAATTINLGATSGTTTTANSLSILGNTTLGDTAADTISFTGSINSNVVPDANNTRNLGSSSLRWNTVYGTTGDFTSIAGTVTGGSTTSSSWTVNSDNATANAEVGSLAFETGTAAFNDVLQWNASGDAGRVTGFDNTNLFNFPVGIFSQVSGANQSFTSGTLFKYAQPTAHAITQSAAFIGTDYDFSTNITVPNTASGNQTGFKTTLKDGGASATSIGFQTAGTLDYGLDIGGTIGTAEIRLSNAETISNTTDGTIAFGGANLTLTAGKTIDLASAGALNIGDTNGTTLTLGAGGALTRTISIGTGTGADTINIGTGTVTADTISIGGLSTTVLATTGTLTHTGTANINTSGSATTAIGNSTGSLTLASGGTSAWTNTSGNLTIQTATSGTLVLDSIGALNIGNTNATSLSIGRTGVTTTNNGALTSTQTLTASNGLTLTTGVLNLTATSGSTSITGYGTTSITSTTASGNIFTLADASLNTTGANLANLTFTNTNAGAGAVTTNGLSITPTGTAITGGGSNTLNAINLPNVTAIASNTFNALNFGTGYTNFITSGTANLTAAGALSGLTSVSASGAISTSGNISTTGTGTITSAGLLTASAGISSGGNLTFSTDNAFDIGASGATRPRTGYFGTSIRTGDGTAAAPSLSFTSGMTTGLYRVSGDSIGFSIGGVGIWAINTPGSFVAAADNTNDIGASGASRPRTGYFGTSLQVGTTPALTGAIRLANNSAMKVRNVGNDADIILGIVNSSNQVRVGDSAWATLIDGTSLRFPGIGTTASAANAFIDGGDNNNVLRSTSSLRYKNLIGDLSLSEAQNIVLNAQPIVYTSKSKADNPNTVYVGFAAEQIATVDARFITYDEQHLPNWVQYPVFTAPLTLIAQNHEKRILTLESLVPTILKNYCVQSESSRDFGLVKNICSQTMIEKLVGSGTYAVKNYLGEVATGGQILAEAVIGNVKAGIVETQELIAGRIVSPIAEIQIVKTDTITPLSSDKIVIKLEDHSATPSATSVPTLEIQNASGSAVASIDDNGNATFSGQLSSKGLNSEEATISGTLRTKSLIAENIDTAILNLRSSITNLSESASSSAVIDIASYSAQLANVDTLQAQVGTFMSGLFAVGPTSLSDATVFGQLSVGGSLTLADNSINVLGTDLQIQPLGQGGVSFLAGKVIIDSSGNLSVNGDAKFNGTLFANLISPIPGNDLVFRLGTSDKQQATSSERFVIQNASGSAVLTVNNQGDLTSSGSARFNDLVAKTFSIVRQAQADTSLNETTASSSAGFAVITAGEIERTIITPFVKENSLIYITPTSDTQGVTPYIARQTVEDLTLGTQASFTIRIPKPIAEDIRLNWWIVN